MILASKSRLDSPGALAQKYLDPLGMLLAKEQDGSYIIDDDWLVDEHILFSHIRHLVTRDRHRECTSNSLCMHQTASGWL
jgi:hypothetical protein